MKLETTPEFKVKKETKKEESNSSSVGGFISFLMSSRTIVHILHLNDINPPTEQNSEDSLTIT